MRAYRFFDPWAVLEIADPSAAAAKVANPAKAETTATPGAETLAVLAGLAAAPVSVSPPPAAAWALATLGEWEAERAAIVEHDGATPREWAEGFARLDPDRPPGDVPPRRWRRFVDDVGVFLDGSFCAAAASFGWTALDLFGADGNRPFARIDQCGLLWLLNGEKLIALTESTATIETVTGARNTFRRKPGGLGRLLAWELVPL